MRKSATLLLFSFLFLHINAQYKSDSVKLPTGGYLHYYTRGEGKPIVFLQGGPGFSSYYMRAIADSLRGYKCILIDYEGTGRSQYRGTDTTWVSPEKVVADIEFVRKKLNIPLWDIVGHSYGTHFGLYYAVTFPQRVRKVVLVSSIGTNNQFQRYAGDNAMVRLSPDDMNQLDAIDADSTLKPLDREFKLQTIMLKPYFFDKSKILPFLKDIPDDENAINFSNDFFNAYFSRSNFWTWDISKKAYALQKPIRIIMGRQDFLNDGKPDIMNLKLKDSKIYFIERSGHFPWLEKPREFFEVLKKEISQ